MNREIKFRIWDNGENKWMLDFNIEILPLISHSVFDRESPVWGISRPCEGPGVTIQLFTGLKDKNNKEIYEGDVLSVCGETCDVDFEHGQFRCFIDGNNILPDVSEIGLDCEIISNIFENIKLIKQ